MKTLTLILLVVGIVLCIYSTKDYTVVVEQERLVDLPPPVSPPSTPSPAPIEEIIVHGPCIQIDPRLEVQPAPPKVHEEPTKEDLQKALAGSISNSNELVIYTRQPTGVARLNHYLNQSDLASFEVLGYAATLAAGAAAVVAAPAWVARHNRPGLNRL